MSGVLDIFNGFGKVVRISRNKGGYYQVGVKYVDLKTRRRPAKSILASINNISESCIKIESNIFLNTDTNLNLRNELMSKENSRWLTALWIFFAFAAWIFAFRGYLTSKFELTSDALSYYDHTKFFIENLGHGIYPLWDPFWYNGASNDFFLRRIGAFNPFYSIILVLKSIGIPYTLSYLWFLGGLLLGRHDRFLFIGHAYLS